MVNPEEIRLLTQQGHSVPEDWRVKRGSVLLAISHIWLKVICPQCIGVVAGSVLVALINGVDMAKAFNIEFISIYSVFLLLLGIVGSCFAAKSARTAALVLLPEGFVCYQNITRRARPSEKAIQTFWYEAISDLRLHIGFWTGTYLEVFFHSGESKKWYPNLTLGRRDELFQDIISAYIAYDIFHASQRERVAVQEALIELL